MAEAEQITARIEELEKLLEEAEQAENQFQSGDMVNFTDDNGEDAVAMVEAVSEDQVTIRIMAVAGDTFEPTDDVLTVDGASLSPMDSDNGDNEENDSDDETENPDEDVEKGVFVSWMSKKGLTKGRVIEVSSDEAVIIPETGDKHNATKSTPISLIEVYQEQDGKWEDTGVHVALPAKDLDIIDPLEVKERRLLVKAKNFEIKKGDDKKYGYLKGIGSAYGKVDLGGDTVARGAYTQTINHNNGKVQLMFNHGYKVSDVAGVASLEDSEEGLMVEGKMPLHVQSVKDSYEIAKFMLEEGKPLGFSIGYQVIKSEPLPNGVRELQEISLEEMTITPWPMDTHARIQDAKSRKITYHSKRRAWQTLNKSTTSVSDAPTGNQPEEGDRKSLTLELKQLNEELKQELNT